MHYSPSIVRITFCFALAIYDMEKIWTIPSTLLLYKNKAPILEIYFSYVLFYYSSNADVSHLQFILLCDFFSPSKES